MQPDGKVLDTDSAGQRRGINRVPWAMRTTPPRVPRAAQIAYGSTQGPRVLPGTYTVRLTSGSETLTTNLQIVLDRRAPYTVADKKAEFDAAQRVCAPFGLMCAAVARISSRYL